MYFFYDLCEPLWYVGFLCKNLCGTNASFLSKHLCRTYGSFLWHVFSILCELLFSYDMHDMRATQSHLWEFPVACILYFMRASVLLWYAWYASYPRHPLFVMLCELVCSIYTHLCGVRWAFVKIPMIQSEWLNVTVVLSMRFWRVYNKDVGDLV